jgi:type II secretory pathway component PulM
MLRYSLLRLLIFLGCVSLFWLVGLRDREELLLLVVCAALLSAVISYFGLRRFREDYSAQLAQKIEQRTAAKQAAPPARSTDEVAEDAEVSGDEGTFR